jgi:hypothetical protein
MRKTIGVWIDDHYEDVSEDGYIERLFDAGVTQFIPVVVGSNYRYRWPIKEIEKLALRIIKLDGEIGVSFWPAKNLCKQDELLQYLEIIGYSGVRFLEADIEYNWKNFQSYEQYLQSANNLFDGLDDISRRHDIRIEMSTLANHPSIVRSAESVEVKRSDSVNLQAYSVSIRNNRIVNYNDPVLGPGGFQSDVIRRARLRLIGRITVGLPAWNQTFTGGYSPEMAMREAFRASIDGPIVDGVRYWSSKWIIGSRKNKYSLDTIERLAICL